MPEPTYEELKAKVAALEAKQRGGGVTFKVSGKGGLSVYGLGDFPVTLYYEQWVRLVEQSQELRGFLEANRSKMKLKNPLKTTKNKKKRRNEEKFQAVQGGLPSLGKKR